MKIKKPTPKKSIYRNQDARIRAAFEKAESPRKVLCVALDFAKSKHVALFCNGNGDILKAPFPVENNAVGVTYLREQIASTSRRRKIEKSCVIIGGEDEPAYVCNFLAALREHGYATSRVSAREAKTNRENLLASTDDLDLLGIAKTLLARRARTVDPDAEGGGIYSEIRELTRARRGLVRNQTAASNRAHALSDLLFPGFLNASKSGVTPFCEASLALMADRFSAPQFARRKLPALENTLRKHGIRDAPGSAGKLLTLASEALAPPPARIPGAQKTLAATADLYACLGRNSRSLRADAAALLAETPYAMLTSIPGIGFVLAAGLAGELGDPAKLPPTDSLCAYAGVVPRTFQSGGPDSPAINGGTGSRYNRTLKDWTVQSSQKIGLYGPPELKDRMTKWTANGQHAAFAGARRYLRLLRTLVRNEVPYLAPSGRGASASKEARAAACQETWKILVAKWRPLPGWRETAFAEDRPLGFWRRTAMEVHKIDLPLG